MSRTISEILLDSVDFLNQVKSGSIQAQPGDVERNLMFLKNLVDNSEISLTDGAKGSAKKAIEDFS